MQTGGGSAPPEAKKTAPYSFRIRRATGSRPSQVARDAAPRRASAVESASSKFATFMFVVIPREGAGLVALPSLPPSAARARPPTNTANRAAVATLNMTCPVALLLSAALMAFDLRRRERFPDGLTRNACAARQTDHMNSRQ